MNALLQWIEERTGVGAAATKCSEHTIPGRACGCKIWPATILFAFCVQAITGFFLWVYYSPSAQTAWGSVYYIQNEVFGGWLVRAMHHYSAHVLLALLMIYVVQTILTGAYRAPRELVFWAGVGMGLFALAAILTGDLLSWDQNGYGSTKTRTGFLTLLPVVGDSLLKIAIGGPGPSLGSHTLTRFFGLHVSVFGGGFIALLILHYIFSRKAEAVQVAKADGAGVRLWSCQSRLNAFACLCVLAVILALACQHGVTGPDAGVFLGSPADSDPLNSYAAARPEWFLTGVFEFSHWFPGPTAVLAIFVIPGALVCLVLAMPFIARRPRGQLFNVAFTLLSLIGLVILTHISWSKDYVDEKHQAAIAAEKEKAARVCELAKHEGIPAAGGLALLQNDPKTEGPRIYEKLCVSCHNCTAGEFIVSVTEKPSAPDLGGFGGREWLAGFMDAKQIKSEKYLGNTRFASGVMVRYVESRFAKLKPEDRKAAIEALAAEAQLPADGDLPLREKGRQILASRECARCHQFYEKGPADVAPDLTGYGSRDWLVGMIADPTQPAFYGQRNDRMQAYLASLAKPADNALSPRGVGAAVDWLRGEWYEPGKEKPAVEGAEPPPQRPSVEILIDRWQRREPQKSATKTKLADLSPRQLFQVEHCAVCHDYSVGGGKDIKAADPSATDLGKYASRAWVSGLLDPKQLKTRKYFGNSVFRTGKMAGFVQDTFADLDDEQKQEIEKIAAALSAEAELPSQREQDKKDAKIIEEGRTLMIETYSCVTCHTFRGRGAKTGPVLTGYGSKAWMIGIISDPQGEAYFPATNDGMPSYHMFPKEPGRNLLTPQQVEAIAEMIRRQE